MYLCTITMAGILKLWPRNMWPFFLLLSKWNMNQYAKKSYLGVWIGKTTIILEINWETGCDCCWFKKAKIVHDFGTISKIPVAVLCSSMLSFPVSIFMYICIVGEFFLGFWMSALIPTHFIFSPIGCACAGPRSRPPVAVTSSLAQSSSAQPRAVQRRASHSHFRLKVQFSKAA